MGVIDCDEYFQRLAVGVQWQSDNIRVLYLDNVHTPTLAGTAFCRYWIALLDRRGATFRRYFAPRRCQDHRAVGNNCHMLHPALSVAPCSGWNEITSRFHV